MSDNCGCDLSVNHLCDIHGQERDAWHAYDSAAEWLAKRGLRGTINDPLPNLISKATCDLINNDPEAFQTRVRQYAYALATERKSTERA